MPMGNSVWPAFWFLPEHDQWPEGMDVLAEIDVMDDLGVDGVYYSNVHTRNGGNVLNSDQYTHNCPDLSLLTPHWYHFERTDEYMRFGFDDIWVKTVVTPPDLKGALHMILNLAVGGRWPELEGGRPTSSTYTFKCSNVVFSETGGQVTGTEGGGERGPNADIIDRLNTLAKEQCAAVEAPINKWISELGG